MSTLEMTDQKIHIPPGEVHRVISNHMLADGFGMVLDLGKSSGSWMFDAKSGRKILDFFSSFASMPVGYNHPKLNTPEFREKIGKIAINKPANSDLYTTYLAEFVDTFSRIVLPKSHNENLFFVEGGALAVENALKTAFDWKIRKNGKNGINGERGSKVLHLREAFHGRSGYTLSLTNTADPRKTQYFPKFDWPRIDNPKLRFPVTAEVEQEVAEAEERALRQAKEAIAENPDDIAAFIMEPIQGEGGDNHFRPEFLRAVRNLCDENEILLIYDEIQTGLGLTGKMWAFQHFDVEPDIFCFGKKTQVCGIASNKRIFDIEDNVFTVSSRINSTWGGNLVDMVRAQRHFEVIEEDRLVENASRVGATIRKELESLAEESGGKITNVRGRGLMIAFDLSDASTRDALLVNLEKNDMMALPSGHRSVRFRPHLVVTEEEAMEGIRRLKQALEQTSFDNG
ncbi:MAG: L-lysine 6-transaminase [Thermoanaerobaculia bacterium]|nr:L-lysine 6-transaminase [Thermoanaerobaculia bacterium]